MACASQSAPAVDYTWSSATTGGLWSGTTNWTPTAALATGPSTGDTATFDSTASGTTRVVTIDSTASAGVGTLTLTQTNSGTNQVSISRNFTVTSAIAVDAMNGGVSRILIIPATTAANVAGTFSGGITVNSGGVLSLGAFSGTTTTVRTGNLVGNVTVQGGSLIVDQITKGTPAGNTGSVANEINGSLTMTSGTFTILNSTTNSTSADRRLSVLQQVNVTGGDVTATGNSAVLQIFGTTTSHTFSPTTFDSSRIGLSLHGSGDQSLALGVQGQLTVRGYGVKTVSSSFSGTSASLLNMVDGDRAVANRGTTLKLGSNLSSTAFPSITNLSIPEVTTNRLDVGIDTNGNTLDLTPNAGVFRPNAVTVSTTNTQVFWALTSSAGTGRIVANGFNLTFSASGTGSVGGPTNDAYTSVGPNVILESRAGSGTANTLSTGTTGITIDPTSIFRYSGTATTANPSTLTSTRSIGDVEVTSGALRISSLAGLQAVRVSGGTLDLGGNSLTVTSGSFGGNVTSGTLTSGTFLASSGTVSASLSGTGSLVKSGAGTLLLSGTNSYSGGTTINGGLVHVGSADALGTTGTISFGGGGIAYTASNTTDYSDRFSTDAGQLYNVNMNGETATWATSLTSGGTSTLTRAGTGLLTLTGTATAIGTGGITINGGTTVIDPGANGTFSTTGKVRIGNSAGAATVTVQSGSVSLAPATNDYIVMADTATGTSTLNVAGGVVTLGLANTRLMVGNKGPAAINVTNGLLEMTGNNPIYLGGDASFTQSNANGTLTIAGGTVSIPSAGTFSIGNSGSAGNTFTGVSGTLNLNGGELRTARAITTSTLGSSPATSTVNFNGGLLTPLASSATFLQGLTTANVQNGGALVNTNGFNVTIAQNLLGAGTGGLTKSGSGTLTLSGSNTFTGDTLVSAGTLALGNAAALSQSVFDTAGAGTLSFGSLTAASLGGIKGSGNVALTNSTPAAVALTVGGTAASSIYSGTFSGAGSLTKVGSGTLTLTGSNTYSGGTTISAGALQLGNGGTTGAVTGPIVNDGTLIFNRQNNTIFSGTISGSGLVVHSGSAQLTLSATNSYTGGTLITGTGSLQISNAAQVGSGTITLRTAGNSTGTVLSLINGVTITNPIVLDQTASNRNNVTVSGGAVTLSGPITITGTGGGVNVFFNSAAGASLAITGNITAPSSYTGALSFRAQTITISGTVNLPAAGFDLNSGGTTILSSTGNVWTNTQFQASSNVLRLGATDAMPTAAALSFSGNSTGGGLDLNGFNQTVPGFSSVTGSIPAPLARIFNNAATDSTLTLAGLTANRSAAIALADGTGGGRLALVMNSAGSTQTLSSATSSYSGGTTIVAGTIALGTANALGSTSGALAVNGGGVDLRGFGLTVGTLSGSSGGRITSGTAGAVTFTASSAANSTFGGIIENGLGTVGFVKGGTGRLDLTGANTYSGVTNVNEGTLLVNGSLLGDVVVASGATLGGSGIYGNQISGAGLVSVGSSPGIGTAASVDPTLGTDWVFEITGTVPTWNAPTNSVNDVLRLTSATPFAANLGGSNEVAVLFSTIQQTTYLGGFYSDQVNFDAAIANGLFTYWVLGNYGDVGNQRQFAVGGGGSLVTYSPLAAFDSGLEVNIAVVAQAADFGGGTVNGYATQFVVVPEPTSLALAGLGAAAAAWAVRVRRRARSRA